VSSPAAERGRTSAPAAGRLATPLALAATAALTAASMLLRPPGLYAAVIAVALLCPWGRPVASILERAGLAGSTRTIAGMVVLVVAVVTNTSLGGQLDGHLLFGGDYHTYYVGALVGVQHGWANLFDAGFQAAAWTASPGARYEFLPYLNTPPTAWVLAPLMGLPYQTGYAVFVALMLVTTAGTAWLVAGASWRARLTTLLVCAALWDVVSTLASGQNAPLGALAIALCWRLMVADRKLLAGLALSLIALRPNATFLVPLALLVAGERRVFLAWLGASAAVGVAVLASLGAHGVQQFIDLAVVVRREHPASMQLTMQRVLGQGALAWALQALLGLTAAIAGARRARGNAAMVLCAGLLGSLLLTPYMHVQDFLPPLTIVGILVLRYRDQGAMAVLLLLLLVAPPGWALAEAWPAAFVGVEVVMLGWLLLREHDIHRKLPAPAQFRHSMVGEA
jgi:hypothetical protein